MRILASAWPEDFFTKLSKALPKEFRESHTTTLRGEYRHQVVLKCMKRRGKDPMVETFDFMLQSDPEPTDAGVADFLGDIRKIAKAHGLIEVRSPAQLGENSFLLGRVEGGFRLLVSEL